MVWKVEFQPQAENDLALIFDHLVETYINFGETQSEALDRAALRVLAMRDSAFELGVKPHRGTKRDDMGKGYRNITINRAIIWFKLLPEEEAVQVLAFFFGGQDHLRHMLTRLLSKE